MEAKHTAGPWAVDGECISAQGQHISMAIGLDGDNYATQKANAQRIVTCVNACEGLTEAELGKFIDVAAALRAQNAELRASLEKIIASVTLGGEPDLARDCYVLDTARAALAKGAA